MCAIFYDQTYWLLISCMIVMQVAAGRCDDLASIQARIEEVVIKSIIYTVSTHYYLHTIYTISTGCNQERPLRPRLHPQRAEAGQEEGDEVHLQLLQTVRVRVLGSLQTSSLIHSNVLHRYDIMLDSQCQPKLIEINSRPAALSDKE